MREALFVFGIILVLLLIVGVSTSPPEDVLLAGQSLMVGGGAVGVPLEAVYFSTLGIALHRRGVLEEGWYWRSFDHHELLLGAERWLVLPWFYLGALSFLVGVFGILISAAGLVTSLLQL